MRGLCNITSECEVTCGMDNGTTYLSQTHYAEDFLHTDNFWNATARLSKDYTHAAQHTPEQIRL